MIEKECKPCAFLRPRGLADFDDLIGRHIAQFVRMPAGQADLDAGADAIAKSSKTISAADERG